MQESGAPNACLPCPLSPLCGAHALGSHHPASREGEGLGMAPSLLLHNLPAQDAHKGAVLTPCINSSCAMGEMTSLLFPEEGKGTLSK